jgi:homoserine/homoserine lactone efflux protein
MGVEVVDIMSLHTYFAFLVSSVILLVIPGPSVMTVISYALSYGRRANVPLVAAVIFGHSTALAMSLLGLGALLAASVFWFTIVKVIGALYIFYLGIGVLRSGIESAEVVQPTKGGSRWRLFAGTYFVTSFNPNSILFFVAFLPQFVNPNEHVGLQLWLLAVSFVALGAINATMYSVFAASVGKTLISPLSRRYLHFTEGSLMSIAGLWALFAWSHV